MGVCQCNEKHKDDGHFVTLKPNADNGHHENHTHIKYSKNSAKPIFKDTKVDWEENVKENMYNQGNLTPAIEPRAAGMSQQPVPENVIEEKNSSKLVENENVFDTSHPSPERCHTDIKQGETNTNNEQEIDYYESSEEIFKIFNDLRINPEKYERYFDSSAFNKLNELRSDPVLKWSLGYDIAFSMITDSNNTLIDRQVSKFLSDASLENGDNLLWTSYSFYGKGTTLEYLMGLFRNNSADLRDILIKNYYNGFVCQIPADENNIRTILCLSVKKYN